MERNVKYIIYIIINYNTFREENDKNNTSKDFIDFFNSYFITDNFNDEIDLNLRFYVSILQSYIQYKKTPNKELIKFWENDIKPYLKNTYPFQQNGIFTVNADVKFLIKEIDDLIAKGNSSSNTNNNTDSKNTINEKNNNNNAHLRMTLIKKHEKSEKNEKTEKNKKEDDK